MTVKLNPGTFQLDPGTVRYLKLLMGLTGKAQTTTLAGIIKGWVKKHRADIDQQLEDAAAAYGVTVEELERAILAGEDLGEPDYTKIVKRPEERRDRSFE